MRGSIRTWLRRTLLSLLEVPSASEFDSSDQKLIDDWLASSVTHRGFHLYVRARDRAIVEFMVKTPVETEAGRRSYYEQQGARLENARLFHRAEAVNQKRSKSLKSAPAVD